MTIEELTAYAERFLADNYGFKLAIPIRRNNRLRRSLGVYKQLMPTYEPYCIELSGELLEFGTNGAILDTLKHELIHYAVHCLGEDWRDGAEYFENELQKHGVGSTNTKTVGKYFLIKCQTCGRESFTNIKRQVEKPYLYRMECCESLYEYTGDIIYNGEEREEIRFADEKELLACEVS